MAMSFTLDMPQLQTRRAAAKNRPICLSSFTDTKVVKIFYLQIRVAEVLSTTVTVV